MSNILFVLVSGCFQHAIIILQYMKLLTGIWQNEYPHWLGVLELLFLLVLCHHNLCEISRISLRIYLPYHRVICYSCDKVGSFRSGWFKAIAHYQPTKSHWAKWGHLSVFGGHIYRRRSHAYTDTRLVGTVNFSVPKGARASPSSTTMLDFLFQGFSRYHQRWLHFRWPDEMFKLSTRPDDVFRYLTMVDAVWRWTNRQDGHFVWMWWHEYIYILIFL